MGNSGEISEIRIPFTEAENAFRRDYFTNSFVYQLCYFPKAAIT